ncbi:MAG TPA: RnfABCDGE type electron transport complex subunit D [Terracidiphilus sp.]|nr:RnfABCDGE type electron transport complex subunit D [Terracidiphilus sp.]
MSQPTTQPQRTESGTKPQFRGWVPTSSHLNPFIPPIFITLILLVGNVSFGILESYTRTLLAIGASVAAEMILGRIFFHKWPHPASSYITGISVGILLRSPAFWPYALCSLLSITSKYALRLQNRHIWNPSNFGICAMLFLASQSVASLSIQWGNNLASLIVIWLLGSVILWRARRLHITLVYVVSFIAFSFLRAHITGDPWQSEVAPITGPMYQLFIFFMITDPKTTVRSRTGQCVVAVIIALVEFVLRLNSSIYAPLYALFWVGPAALLIEMWISSRRNTGGDPKAVSA